MSIRCYALRTAIRDLATGTSKVRRVYAALLWRLSLDRSCDAEIERLLAKAMEEMEEDDRRLEKYRICKYCERGRYTHVGDKLKCLFHSTHFEPATDEDVMRWEERDKPWMIIEKA